MKTTELNIETLTIESAKKWTSIGVLNGQNLEARLTGKKENETLSIEVSNSDFTVIEKLAFQSNSQIVFKNALNIAIEKIQNLYND